MVRPPDAFEKFVYSSIFDKTACSLGEKEGRLVNVECRSWYNSVGNFLHQFGIGGERCYILTDQHA